MLALAPSCRRAPAVPPRPLVPPVVTRSATAPVPPVRAMHTKARRRSPGLARTNYSTACAQVSPLGGGGTCSRVPPRRRCRVHPCRWSTAVDPRAVPLLRRRTRIRRRTLEPPKPPAAAPLPPQDQRLRDSATRRRPAAPRGPLQEPPCRKRPVSVPPYSRRRCDSTLHEKEPRFARSPARKNCGPTPLSAG